MPWIYTITIDHLADPADDENSIAGRVRRSRGDHPDRPSPDELLALPLSTPNLYRFKLYDDDGELYYEGRIWHCGADDENLFRPQDWAMHDAGVTTTKLQSEANGPWEVL